MAARLQKRIKRSTKKLATAKSPRKVARVKKRVERLTARSERKAASNGFGADDATLPYVSGLGGGPKNVNGYQNRPNSAPSETSKG